MISVKCFKDGNRYIVSMEGEDEKKCQEIVKKIFSEMIDVTFEIVGESNAVALPPEDNTIPEVIPEAQIAPNNEIEDAKVKNTALTIKEGKYKGKTPLEIVSGEISDSFADVVSGNKEDEPKLGFKHLVLLLHEKGISKEFKRDITFAIKTYLHSYFSKFEFVGELDKLNSQQLYDFFNDLSYGGCVSKSKKTELVQPYGYEKWEDFINNIDSDLQTAKELAVEFVSMFLKM